MKNNFHNHQKQAVQVKKHYKMFKDGKNWVVAGVSTLALAGAIGLGTIDVHADTTDATTTQTATAATTSDDVQVDSSPVTNAASAASSTGVTVTQDATQTVTSDSLSDAQAQVQSDYDSQAASLAATTDTQASNNSSYAASEAQYETDKAAYDSSEAQYEQDEAKYQQDLADLNAKLNAGNTGDAVSSNDVIQGLQLNKMPESTINVVSVIGGATADVVTDSTVNGNLGINNTDSTSILHINTNQTSSINGVVAVIEYDNLASAGSTYTDSDGKVHTIAKIVRTLSDMAETSSDYLVANNSNVLTLDIYSDITDGFWYDGSDGVTVTDVYYDTDGNVINFSDGTAYLAISSLNSWTDSDTTYAPDENGVPVQSGTDVGRVEGVKSVDGSTTQVALLGSSVTNHDDGLYSSVTNEDWAQDINGNKFSQVIGWDNAGTDKTYYGTGLLSMSGDSISYRAFENIDKNSGNGAVWFITSTIIPATPDTQLEEPTPPTAPVAPTLETTSASYHLDTIVVNPGTPTKIADNEGKTLVAGTTTTQHITQYTGVGQNLDGFFLTDALVYTDDGRLPVSFDTDNWTVTTDDGTDVTAQGTFTESDATVNGKSVHEVTWTPNDTSTLLENTYYTLNPYTKTIVDGIEDTEIDFGITSFGITDEHSYNEYVPDPEKNWINDEGEVTNGKVYLAGSEATAELEGDLPNQDDLIEPLNNLQLVDDYSQSKDYLEFLSMDVYENGEDVTDQYTITDDPTTGKATATRNDPSATPSGTVKLVPHFKIKDDVPSGTVLLNGGSMIVNDDEEPVPDVPITVETPDPKKEIIDDAGNSLDNGTIALNDTVPYVLDGAVIPSNESEPLTQYGFIDDYDEGHDAYQDHKVVLTVDVQLKDGTLLPKGTDVTEYTTFKDENGVIDIEFTSDFLDTVAIQDDSYFGAKVLLNMKRWKAGENIPNTLINIINGVAYITNTVHTSTPEPEEPETPVTPETPATPTVEQVSVTPVSSEPAQTLPQTGEADESAAVALGLVGLFASIGALGARKKKKVA